MALFKKPPGEPKKSRDIQRKAANRAIEDAFAKESSMDVLYQSKKGLVERRIDPYEQRGGELWAYCHTHSRIHRWYTSRIIDSNVTETGFKQRWPVQGRVE